jgi:hypothetical protein
MAGTGHEVSWLQAGLWAVSLALFSTPALAASVLERSVRKDDSDFFSRMPRRIILRLFQVS